MACKRTSRHKSSLRNQFKLKKDVDCYLFSVAYDRYLKPRHLPEQIAIQSIVLWSGRNAKDSMNLVYETSTAMAVPS